MVPSQHGLFCHSNLLCNALCRDLHALYYCCMLAGGKRWLFFQCTYINTDNTGCSFLSKDFICPLFTILYESTTVFKCICPCMVPWTQWGAVISALKVWKGAWWRCAFAPCRLEARRVPALWGVALGWGTPWARLGWQPGCGKTGRGGIHWQAGCGRTGRGGIHCIWAALHSSLSK